MSARLVYVEGEQAPPILAELVPGAVVEWDTWCGPARGTVDHVGLWRITVALPGRTHACWSARTLVWEATCSSTLAEVVGRVRGLRVVTS